MLMPHPITSMDAVPDLDVGINLLETPAHRTTALHQIALSHLREADGPAVWIDARGNSATYLLENEFRPRPKLQIARAFTAYQHYELVRTLPGDLPRNASLIVLPCLPSLYDDEDVPDWEGERYLESALCILTELSKLTDIPILASCVEGGALLDLPRRAASQTITFEKTDLGYRFEADDFETTVYWGDGYFQTTITYWVELLGAVDDATPAQTIVDEGLIAGTV